MSAAPLRSVLYVDDEPDIREIVKIALSLTPTVAVHTAESGQQALTLARSLLPDLVLLDVMMPGLDGPATLSRMRKDPVISPIPVIFMTAKAMPNEVALLQQMGAAGVIAKPFDPMSLGVQVVSLWKGRLDYTADPGEKVNQPAMRRQISQFGERFLQRTRTDTVRLRNLIGSIRPGDATAIVELERIAHRIHGSGSTFGFAALSQCAEEIEQLIKGLRVRDAGAGTTLDSRTCSRLSECTERLAHEIEAAAKP